MIFFSCFEWFYSAVAYDNSRNFSFPQIPPCKHHLVSSVAFRGIQQCISALRVQCIPVISGYFEENEERSLKAEQKKHVLKGRKFELQPDSQTQALEVSIISITELCLHCVLFSALLLVPYQGHELYNCGTNIIII